MKTVSEHHEISLHNDLLAQARMLSDPEPVAAFCDDLLELEKVGNITYEQRVYISLLVIGAAQPPTAS